MKRILLFSLFIAMVLTIIQSCKKSSDGNDLMQTKVEFAFSSGLLKTIGEQGLTHIVVSIEDMQGNVILNSEKIAIYNLNDSYISESISLVVGEYQLTRFLVLNAANDVVYASPLKDSPKANLVQNPLPITFTARTDSMTQINPSVLSTYDNNAGDFGYVSFSFDIADSFDILVGAYIYNDTTNNFEMTTADISIFSDTTTVYSGVLQTNNTQTSSSFDSLNVTNKISLPEKYNNFTIVIQKTGHATYFKTFTKEALRLYYRPEDNGPLVVELGVPCSLSADSVYFGAYPATQIFPDATVFIEYGSISDADIYVLDYGDGTTLTKLNYSPTPYQHTYSTPGNYLVKLTVIKDGCECIKEQLIRILPPEYNDSTVVDIDGNVYHTVEIGTQTWLVENLKVTRFNDGSQIPYISDNTEWANLATPGFCWHENDSSNWNKLNGGLYNWYTVNTGKLAPKGWHVPSESEWMVMVEYLKNNGYGYLGNKDNIAKSIALGYDWSASEQIGSPGYLPETNNITGFSARPSELRSSDGNFSDIFGIQGNWWSSTGLILGTDTNDAAAFLMVYDHSTVGTGNRPKLDGHPVRCIKD